MKRNFDFKTWEPLLRSYRTIASEDSSNFLQALNDLIPIEIKAYPSGKKYGSWTIPDEWHLNGGRITGEGIDLSSEDHGLLVQTYSQPVDIKITKNELRPHVIFDEKRPNDFIYYSKLSYQYPKNISWRLSIPYSTWENLPDTTFHVKIDSSFKAGSMKTGLATLPGRSKHSIIFVAHYCHPYQFDDGLGGVATAVELYNRLKLQERNLTYKFLFVPETIGSVVELLSTPLNEIRDMIGGFFVEAPGKKIPLSVKRPHKVSNEFSNVVQDYLQDKINPENFKSFRSNVSNDEIVFGDPDFDIPIFSLQRWPFDEYHTERDNLSNFDEVCFYEVCDILSGIVDRLENNFFVSRKFRGPLYMFGYDLHVNYADNKDKFFDNWEIMNASGEELTINQISRKTGLPFKIVNEYYKEYLSKGLVSLDLDTSYK